MPEEIIENQRTQGKKAISGNILAAKSLSDIVKTTLGPRGMDKMLVDGQGRIIVTNDGVTILNDMQITHPAAKLISDIAKTQEKEIGDGTTTVTMLVGELLRNAEKLIEKGVHPTTIIKGYNLAEIAAQSFLKQNSVKVENSETLQKIAQTAMTGKGAEGHREHLAEIIVEAVKISEKDNIIFNGIIGKPVGETRILKGLVLDMEIPESMPKKLQDVRVGLLDIDLDVRQTEVDTQVQFNSFDEISKFQKSEDEQFKEFAQKIINSEVDIVFCTQSINDKVIYHLAKEGIVAVRRVNKFDMDMLVKTTGAILVSSLDDFNTIDGSPELSMFGKAGKIYQERYSDDEVKIFIEDCPKDAVTILVCSTSEHLLKEVKRAMTDGLGDVLASKDDYVVAGGGAIEVEVARELRNYAHSLSGMVQLAVEEFADALETVPETLAENSGLNSINTLTKLKKDHADGKKYNGLNLFTDKIEDTLEKGIIEPLKIKTLAISSATEVANQILRVDDLLMAKNEQ